jgi:hypothetical protein
VLLVCAFTWSLTLFQLNALSFFLGVASVARLFPSISKSSVWPVVPGGGGAGGPPGAGGGGGGGGAIDPCLNIGGGGGGAGGPPNCCGGGGAGGAGGTFETTGDRGGFMVVTVGVLATDSAIVEFGDVKLDASLTSGTGNNSKAAGRFCSKS